MRCEDRGGQKGTEALHLLSSWQVKYVRKMKTRLRAADSLQCVSSFFFLGEMFSSDQSDIKVLFLMNTGDIMTAYLDLSLVLVQPLPTCSSRLSSPADGGLSHLKCTLCFWEPIPKTVMKKKSCLKILYWRNVWDKAMGTLSHHQFSGPKNRWFFRSLLLQKKEHYK